MRAIIIMLTDFPEDIRGVIFNKLDDVSLIVLCHVDKKYHQIVSSWGSKNEIKRVINCHYVASLGYLEIIKLLDKVNFDRVCYHATSNGHLNILKWLKDKGYEFNSVTSYTAAARGHLHILKWLEEIGCETDWYTFFEATKHGHLKILKWAKENNYNVGSNICYWAAANEHLDILIWAREIGFELCMKTNIIARKKWPKIFN